MQHIWGRRNNWLNWFPAMTHPKKNVIVLEMFIPLYTSHALKICICIWNSEMINPSAYYSLILQINNERKDCNSNVLRILKAHSTLEICVVNKNIVHYFSQKLHLHFKTNTNTSSTHNCPAHIIVNTLLIYNTSTAPATRINWHIYFQST